MRIFLLFLTALVLAACGDGAALDRLASGGVARVVEVRSADLVILEDGTPVKLAGLETLSPREPYGREARAALEALVLGKEVELLAGGAAEDPFGRRVAHLRLVKGRRWVQGRMLSDGAARVRTFPDQRALAAEMLEREAKARAAGRGLWALDAYQVRLPWEARGGFEIVEGRVVAVRRLGGDVVLDLGRRLEALIPARAVADFDAAGRPLEPLAGRLVRVRGAVRGRTLRLDHPEALELLSPSPSRGEG